MNRAIALVLLFLAPSAFADLRVTFVEPDRYADGGLDRFDSEKNRKELERFFQDLARKYLGPGQNLEIEILDIDLAGQVRFPPRGATQMRVMTGGADWPRFKLRYSFESAPGVVRKAEEMLSDPEYLVQPRRTTGQSLEYEKRMLEAWFRKTFGPAPAKK